ARGQQGGDLNSERAGEGSQYFDADMSQPGHELRQVGLRDSCDLRTLNLLQPALASQDADALLTHLLSLDTRKGHDRSAGTGDDRAVIGGDIVGRLDRLAEFLAELDEALPVVVADHDEGGPAIFFNDLRANDHGVPLPP